MNKPNFYSLSIFDDVQAIDYDAVAALLQTEMSPEIAQSTIETSVVLSQGYRLPNMSTHQMKMPIASMLPVAYFLGSKKDRKKVTSMAWEDKFLDAGEIAVVVPFKEDVVADSNYDIVGQAKARIPEAFARVLDEAVLFGVGKPSFWPKGIFEQATEAGATVEASANLYDDLLGVGGTISKVEESGYFVNAHVAAIRMRAQLRGLKDNDGRPIFLNNMQQSGNYTLDGSPIVFPRTGAFDPSKAQIISGDFKQLVYSIRQEIDIKIFTEGAIQDPATGEIVYNLMQDDMFAIRAVMRIGWNIPNPVNNINSTATRFPFAVLLPKVADSANFSLRSTGGNTGSAEGYTEEGLNAMTIDQIKALASGLGYTITTDRKADIVAEFLAQQTAQG